MAKLLAARRDQHREVIMMSHQVLIAKQQAWCVAMLSILTDAYKLGAVLGADTPIRLTGSTFIPANVVFVPTELSKIVRSDDILPGAYGPALVVDIFSSAISESVRVKMRERYSAARVLEVWQVDADRGRAKFYQADATWRYEQITPDKTGTYFSAAAEELFFPAAWFREQPTVFNIMQYWGMIDD